MSVKLKWAFRGRPVVATQIYRSNAYFDAGNLPAALASVAVGVTSYEDTAVTNGTRYFYRVGSLVTGPSPDILKLSEIVEIVAQALKVLRARLLSLEEERRAAQLRVRTQLASRRVAIVGVSRAPGWSQDLALTVKAFEGACAGAPLETHQHQATSCIDCRYLNDRQPPFAILRQFECAGYEVHPPGRPG